MSDIRVYRPQRAAVYISGKVTVVLHPNQLWYEVREDASGVWLRNRSGNLAVGFSRWEIKQHFKPQDVENPRSP